MCCCSPGRRVGALLGVTAAYTESRAKVQSMPRYDFKSLSSQDFEELIRDLLQAEWNVSLEAFRTGRDGGIDLRYAPADGGTTVIQCKHYAASGFSKLLAHLHNSERPKIARLGPSRYIVATS